METAPRGEREADEKRPPPVEEVRMTDEKVARQETGRDEVLGRKVTARSECGER